MRCAPECSQGVVSLTNHRHIIIDKKIVCPPHQFHVLRPLAVAPLQGTDNLEIIRYLDAVTDFKPRHLQDMKPPITNTHFEQQDAAKQSRQSVTVHCSIVMHLSDILVELVWYLKVESLTLVNAPGWNVHLFEHPGYWTRMSPRSVIRCTVPIRPICWKTMR